MPHPDPNEALRYEAQLMAMTPILSSAGALASHAQAYGLGQDAHSQGVAIVNLSTAVGILVDQNRQLLALLQSNNPWKP